MFNIREVIPNVLYGGCHPLLNTDFNLIDIPDFYTQHEINSIITLHETPISPIITHLLPCDYHFQSVKDGDAPSNLYNLCDYISSHTPAFAHCFAGGGRTSALLTAFLLYSGKFNKVKNAVLWLRKHYCDEALHTPQQYKSLLEFNGEKKNDDELADDIDELFTERFQYDNFKKYAHQFILAKRELDLIGEKYGENSAECYHSLSNYNKIIHLLQLLR